MLGFTGACDSLIALSRESRLLRFFGGKCKLDKSLTSQLIVILKERKRLKNLVKRKFFGYRNVFINMVSVIDAVNHRFTASYRIRDKKYPSPEFLSFANAQLEILPSVLDLLHAHRVPPLSLTLSSVPSPLAHYCSVKKKTIKEQDAARICLCWNKKVD